MADKCIATNCLLKYFREDATDIFIYGSTIYLNGSQKPKDTDAVVITEGDSFFLFRGEIPELGKTDVVLIGKDELYRMNERKDIPLLARPPFSSLTCPHSLIYENEKERGFHKEIYWLLAENVLDYVLPRMWLVDPYMDEILLEPKKLVLYLRDYIGPFAEPNLTWGEMPQYLKKWDENVAWQYTEDIICRDYVRKYLHENNLILNEFDDSFLIRLPKQQIDMKEDRKRISEWREKKLKPARTHVLDNLIA